ncbi:MAG: hypothetical protein ACRC62_08305 [Microcoleus sp.]
MPQNVIAQQMALEPTEEPTATTTTVVEAVPVEAVAVESYADRLMDELFAGVDRAFDERGMLAESGQPEFVALKQISVPQIILSQPALTAAPAKDVEAIARQVALETTQKHQSKQSFDKMLLGAAFGSLLLVLGLWLASRSGLVRLPEVAATSATTTEAAKAQPDTEFVEYVQRSLEAIEQRKPAQVNPQLPGVPGSVAPGSLPNIQISGAPPANAGLSSAVNRIADAIEQAATQPGAPAPQVVILPPAQAPAQAPGQAPVQTATPTQTTSVSPSPTTQSSGRAIASAGTPAQSPAAASPSTSEAPQPRILARETESSQAPAADPAPAAPQPAAAPAAPPASSAPTAAHTLVGILELGDRSAALFEIDGVARRIYVGESIGASGWTLAEIKNQEAVIRKGGDVRSVFVGQKF